MTFVSSAKDIHGLAGMMLIFGCRYPIVDGDSGSLIFDHVPPLCISDMSLPFLFSVGGDQSFTFEA